ncbi:MAG TPA: hypothetical protein VLT15_01915 [Acidimicrobiia bacterium]|nr:hypothetical protein [Acidimicrobiia bacterium]
MPHFFGITGFGERGEPDEVYKERRDEPALLGLRGIRGDFPSRRDGRRGVSAGRGSAL